MLLPVPHEEAVIQDTIQQVVDLNYPRELTHVLVVIEVGDYGAIAKWRKSCRSSPSSASITSAF